MHPTGTSCSKRQNHLHPCRTLRFATWNIRTLVENAGGDRRICRARPTTNSSSTCASLHQVDRKVDLLANELKCYRVSVAGVQETKWFGSDVWEVDGYTFLHSGRRLPADGEVGVRGEGVGIMLDP